MIVWLCFQEPRRSPEIFFDEFMSDTTKKKKSKENAANMLNNEICWNEKNKKHKRRRRKKKQRQFTAKLFFIFMLCVKKTPQFRIDLMWRWIKIETVTQERARTRTRNRKRSIFHVFLSLKFSSSTTASMFLSFQYSCALINHSKWINIHARSFLHVLLIVKGYEPSLCFAFM
jgi:hypothetical protein